ncbi:bifunctional DNA primase/polymerase [Streptomyces sp. NPDC002855]|uniref:bifunctional DNA primase/polymerase n=1 Tax=Streptomyces sp. NPDC002855 TaxID=3154437 RepID=UPI0033169DED
MTSLNYALSYAARGWRVVPAPRGKKFPVLALWQDRATTKEATITNWWALRPDANVCIATGQQSNLWVLDVDDKNNAGGSASLAQLEARHGHLPPTYVVGTGTGGLHYYFTWEGVDFDLRNSAGKLGNGLDTRGNGGQVVAPPSRSEAGLYRLMTSGPPTPAPTWLLHALRPEPASQSPGGACLCGYAPRCPTPGPRPAGCKAPPRTDQWTKHHQAGGPAGILGWLSSAQPGDQNGALTWALHRLHDDGITRTDAAAMTWAVVRNWPCSAGPWTEHDVEKRIRSIWR